MGRQREVATPCCLSLFYIAAKVLLFFEIHKTFYFLFLLKSRKTYYSPLPFTSDIQTIQERYRNDIG